VLGVDLDSTREQQALEDLDAATSAAPRHGWEPAEHLRSPPRACPVCIDACGLT
jgi:hypothetical protein